MQKKRCAITDILFLSLAGLLSYSSTSFAENCLKSDQMNFLSLNKSVSKLTSRICYSTESEGHIKTTIAFRGSGKTNNLISIFSGEGFSPEIDESIDFNGDGIPDLGLSNGGGRSGDGFDYWWYDSSDLKYKKLGDFSRLTIDKSQPGTFFSMVSSTDQYYARRYNFTFHSGKLTRDSVYGFSHCADGPECIEVVVLEPKNASGKRKRFLPGDVEKCMDGSAPCFK